MRLFRLTTLAVVAGLVLVPAGAAQTTGEPIELNVREVKVPNKTGSLLSRGVYVEASCTPECLLVVKVRVPPGIARKMGLHNRVVGSGVGFSSGGGVAQFRIKVRRGARDAIASYQGSGSFQVKVSALP